MNPSPRYQFGTYTLDAADRQLWNVDERIDVNARYLDALILLVERSPHLIEKDHFFNTVWQDVVVSDNALSQCIKELRRVLNDDASEPRFIQTVPRHGYRFVGNVSLVNDASLSATTAIPSNPALQSTKTTTASRLFAWWAAWAAGGALAGLIGGMLYGFGLSSPEAGVGTLSTLLVLITLNVLVGTTGGAGIGAGFIAGWTLSKTTGQSRALWLMLGCGAGGLLTGGAAKMLGLDAFNLLFGKAPSGMTGGFEGAVLGLAIASGMLLGERFLEGPRMSARMAGALGSGALTGAAGLALSLSGGHLMGGSLRLLAESFSESRLEWNALMPLFGQLDASRWSEAALAGMEGLIFGACLMGVWGWVCRRISD